MPSPGKHYSHPHANLNNRPLRPSQQTGRETNIKEVCELETWTVNNNCKHDQTAIAEYDEPNPPPNTVKPLRQIVTPVRTIDPTIMVEQETP